MSVVDAQVHVWADNTPERPWPAGHGEPQRADPLTADELLGSMADAGVDKVVLVPPSWQGDSNAVALEAAEAHPDRFAVMGRFDALSGPKPLPTGMLGVRLTLHTAPGIRALAQRDLDWFWRDASAAGLPVMVYAPGNPGAVDDVAARFPDLRIAICHSGLNIDTRGADDVGRELEALWPLAERENVAVKASALPCYLGTDWDTQAQIVRRMVDVFGERRVFWGSDLSRLPVPYGDLSAFFRDLDVLSVQEREWVLGAGVLEWLGWQA